MPSCKQPQSSWPPVLSPFVKTFLLNILPDNSFPHKTFLHSDPPSDSWFLSPSLVRLETTRFSSFSTLKNSTTILPLLFLTFFAILLILLIQSFFPSSPLCWSLCWEHPFSSSFADLQYLVLKQLPWFHCPQDFSQWVYLPWQPTVPSPWGSLLQKISSHPLCLTCCTPTWSFQTGEHSSTFNLPSLSRVSPFFLPFILTLLTRVVILLAIILQDCPYHSFIHSCCAIQGCPIHSSFLSSFNL